MTQLFRYTSHIEMQNRQPFEYKSLNEIAVILSDESRNDADKKDLPAIRVSNCDGEYTGHIQFDIDGVPTGMQHRLVEYVATWPCTAMVFESPSGGVKAFLRINNEDGQEWETFSQSCLDAASILLGGTPITQNSGTAFGIFAGMHIDPSTMTDFSKWCFIPKRAQVHYNTNVEPMRITKEMISKLRHDYNQITISERTDEEAASLEESWWYGLMTIVRTFDNLEYHSESMLHEACTIWSENCEDKEAIASPRELANKIAACKRYAEKQPYLYQSTYDLRFPVPYSLDKCHPVSSVMPVSRINQVFENKAGYQIRYNELLGTAEFFVNGTWIYPGEAGRSYINQLLQAQFKTIKIDSKGKKTWVRLSLKKEAVNDFVTLASRPYNPRNPLREWLEALPDWKQDDPSIINTIIDSCFVVPPTYSKEYRAWAAFLPLITIVSRAFQSIHPTELEDGVNVQRVLFLSGLADAGKSLFARSILPSRWFTDSVRIHEIDQKIAEDMKGKGLGEIGEMAGINYSTQEQVKTNLTKRFLNYRWVFKDDSVERPIWYTLIATANSDRMLPATDAMQRRFFPIEVEGRGEHPGVFWDKYRELIFAEAVYYYKLGWRPEHLPEYLANEQRKHNMFIAHKTDEVFIELLDYLRNNLGTPNNLWDDGVSVSELRANVTSNKSHLSRTTLPRWVKACEDLGGKNTGNRIFTKYAFDEDYIMSYLTEGNDDEN